MLTGCAQDALAPQINAATIRLLNRAGVDVVLPQGEGCCGSMLHHMGREAPALDQARANIDVWMREIDGAGLEAIVITASGCGATIKDYAHMLRNDPAYADKAARVAALARDVSEYVADLELPYRSPQKLVVAYHAACSLQHGQKILEAPKALLRRAGFEVRNPAEAHICCGSAGTYNILQPEMAGALRKRKVANLERLKPDVIAAGNIGCLAQIASGTANARGAHGGAARLGERRAEAGGGGVRGAKAELEQAVFCLDRTSRHRERSAAIQRSKRQPIEAATERLATCLRSLDRWIASLRSQRRFHVAAERTIRAIQAKTRSSPNRQIGAQCAFQVALRQRERLPATRRAEFRGPLPRCFGCDRLRARAQSTFHVFVEVADEKLRQEPSPPCSLIS